MSFIQSDNLPKDEKDAANDFSFSSSGDEQNPRSGDKAQKLQKKQQEQNQLITTNFNNQSSVEKKQEIWNVGEIENRAERRRSRSRQKSENTNLDLQKNQFQGVAQNVRQPGYDRWQENFGGDGDWQEGERGRGIDRDNKNPRKTDQRDRFNDKRSPARIKQPSLSQPLLTRKEFENYQDGKFDRQELQEAYNDYVQEFKREQEYDFYQEHRKEPWFLERYEPSEIQRQKQIQFKLSQYNAQTYRSSVLESLLKSQAGGEKSQYFNIKLEQDPVIDYNLLVDQDGQDVQLQKAPLFSFDTDLLTLYLKYIPVNVKRVELTEKLEQSCPGFVHLSMSEPMRNHSFNRLAWATFTSQANCDQALQNIMSIQLDNFYLTGMKSHPNRKRAPIRITPPLPEEQVTFDIVLCQLLIEKVLDPEKGIETFIVNALDQLKNENDPEQNQICLSERQKLDLLILYLRRVHAYCLYCGDEYEDERMLATRCGPQHVRNHQKISLEDYRGIISQSGVTPLLNIFDMQSTGNFSWKTFEQKQEMEFADPTQEQQESNRVLEILKEFLKIKSNFSNNWSGSMQFLIKYMGQTIKRIEGGPKEYKDPQQEFMEKDLINFCQTYVKEIERGEKYGCKKCPKVFKGEQFAIKHIKNVHADFIEEAYERESTKEWLQVNFQKLMKKETKENYYSDPNKLFNQPGRRYFPAETSYYVEQKQEERSEGRGYRGYNNRGGNRRTQNKRNYIDYDDPQVNISLLEKKQNRELVDYSELFG